jgi:hypothetical protein
MSTRTWSHDEDHADAIGFNGAGSFNAMNFAYSAFYDAYYAYYYSSINDSADSLFCAGTAMEYSYDAAFYAAADWLCNSNWYSHAAYYYACLTYIYSYQAFGGS